MCDELRAEAAATPAFGDANALNIPGKCALHHDQDESCDISLQFGDTDLFCRIGDEPEPGLIIAAQGFPRLGARHHACAAVGLVEVVQRANKWRWHGSSPGAWNNRQSHG